MEAALYVNAIKGYLSLNKKVISEEQKAPFFLNIFGSEARKFLTFAFKPKKVEDQKFEDLEAKFLELFQRKKNVEVERAKFNTTTRQSGEALIDFFVRVQEAAEFCEFEAGVDARVKSQFISGVNDKKIFEKLLSLDKTKTANDAL